MKRRISPFLTVSMMTSFRLSLTLQVFAYDVTDCFIGETFFVLLQSIHVGANTNVGRLA